MQIHEYSHTAAFKAAHQQAAAYMALPAHPMRHKYASYRECFASFLKREYRGQREDKQIIQFYSNNHSRLMAAKMMD